MLESKPFVYGPIEGGHRRRLIFGALADALYTALGDLHRNRAEPMGIRQGANVLYWKADLERLYAEHRATLAASQDWAVVLQLRKIDVSEVALAGDHAPHAPA